MAEPLIIHFTQAQGEWQHIYAQPDGNHIRLLIVVRQRTEAVVAEVRVDPDQLSAFIDNPQILGIPLKSGRIRTIDF